MLDPLRSREGGATLCKLAQKCLLPNCSERWLSGAPSDPSHPGCTDPLQPGSPSPPLFFSLFPAALLDHPLEAGVTLVVGSLTGKANPGILI